MSVWDRDEEIFKKLPLERQAKIEIVSSAYASVFAEKAYLTMPITTGRRYYDVLDHYKVKTVEELENKRPGALREEIILPNIEDGKALAKRIRQNSDADALIVPGVFEARKERWTQDEYMVLWLKLITSDVKLLYLSDGWEYSNGGAIEVAHGLAKQLGLVGDFRKWAASRSVLEIYDKDGRMDIIRAAKRLAEAIQDLRKREHKVDTLCEELGKISAIAWHGADLANVTYHWEKVCDSARSVGVDIRFK